MASKFTKFIKKHFWDFMLILGILILLLAAATAFYPSLVNYMLNSVLLQLIIFIILAPFIGIVGWYAWQAEEDFYKELWHSFKKKKK